MNLDKHTSNVIPLATLTVLVTACFWNAVALDFVWDDHLLVSNRDIYRSFDLFRLLFTLVNGLEYQPVRDITYAIDFLLWNTNPVGFHVSNLIYYWLNCVIIYFFSKKLYGLLVPGDSHGAWQTGFLTTIFFAVHPLHCEVSDFITCRNALISGIFFFLSCHAYILFLTERNKFFYTLSLLCFILSLFSKTTAIILPFILILVSEFAVQPERKKNAVAIFPFLFLSVIAFGVFKNIAQNSHIMQPEILSAGFSQLAEKFVLAVQIIVFYLTKLLVPTRLAAEYDTPFANSFFAMRTLVALAIIASLGAFGWIQRQRFPALIFCLGWYLISLIPVLHLFPTNPIVADRYGFIPSFAFFFLLAAGASGAAKRRCKQVIAGATIIITCWSVLTIRQNRVWKNPKTLWEHAIKVSPCATVPLTNLGRYYYLSEKNSTMALTLFKRAQELNPYDTHLELFLGVEYLLRNEPHNAISVFQSALAKNPNQIEVLLNTGKAYEASGNLQQARAYYKRALHSTEADPPGNIRERARLYLQRLDAQ